MTTGPAELETSPAEAWEVCRDMALAKPPALAFQWPPALLPNFPRALRFLKMG